jgi:acetyl-CoA C-acetyltransferase
MRSRQRCGVVGVGMSPFTTNRSDTDFLGLLQESTYEALEDAGLEMREIDAVVLAQAPDAMHGISNPEQLAVSALGAKGKPVFRVHTGGATGSSAAQVGWWGVASGRYDRVLVVGADKMGDCTGGAQEVLNKIWDPAYESALPLNTIVMVALQGRRYMHQHGSTVEQLAVIASRMRNNGARNPKAHLRKPVTPEQVLASPLLAYPTHRDMACPRSSGGCAIVMAGESAAHKLGTPIAWVNGIAARTNTYFMGDKMGDCGPNDHASEYELRLGAQEAYAMAGITSPAEEIDVVEPYVPFACMEPPTLEALQLCGPGEAPKLAEQGHWDLGGKIAVSPSGGVLCANPISVTALVRVAEAAQQVRERAGDHQVDGVRTAVSTGAGGSVQFFVTSVLGRDPV